MKIIKYICHQKPERSFFYKNHQFPLCARCTGFYTGLLIYLLSKLFITYNYTISTFLISQTLMIPTLIDSLGQYFGPRESKNSTRFITGILGGLGLIIFLKSIISFIIS